MMRRRSRAEPDLAAVASVAQRLAVLLAAGVAPVAAWGYLEPVAESAGPSPSTSPSPFPFAGATIAAEVASRAAAGGSIPHAIVAAVASSQRMLPAEASAWRSLAVAWAVATEAGAPLAPTLLDLAASFRDLAQAQRDIRVALAEPAATARMVLALPAVGVIFGMLLGFDTLTTLSTTPIGWACLTIGGLLLAAGARWNRALVRSAAPRELSPGLDLDLVAIAVSGGGAIDRATAMVDAAVSEFGAGPRRATARAREHPRRAPHAGTNASATSTTSTASTASTTSTASTASTTSTASAVDAVLDLSRRAGVPAAGLLRSEASEARRAARAEVRERAARLSVTLMLPLGLCVLPAFMVLGVLPLVVTVIGSTVGRF